MAIRESGEMYLETILILRQRLPHVRSIDVAEYMKYSKPSVSRAVGILKEQGYLTVDGDGYLELTPLGEADAAKIYERHMILTRALTALGVEEEIAAEDACRLEHGISDASLAAIKAHLLAHRP